MLIFDMDDYIHSSSFRSNQGNVELFDNTILKSKTYNCTKTIRSDVF